MSKAARDAFYRQDALDFEKGYEAAEEVDELELPLTRAGFEILLREVSNRYMLPIDDGCRSVLAGYIHHIPNDKNTATIQELAVVLHKSISNNMTWQIDQEIKEALRKEESTPLTVVGDSPGPAPTSA